MNTNLTIYDFDDFITITKEKIGTRILENLAGFFYLTKYNIPSHNNIFHQFSKFKISNKQIFKETFTNNGDNSDDFKFYLKERDGLESTLKEIIKGECSKPIIFFYRNPYRSLISGIWEDVSFIHLDWNSKLASLLQSFNPSKYQSLLNILTLLESKNKNYENFSNNQHLINIKLDIRDVIDIINDLSKEEKTLVLDLLDTSIKNEVVINNLENTHTGLWLEPMWPIISQNKNISLVNLDSEKFVDFIPHLNSKSNIQYPPQNRNITKSNKKYYRYVIDSLNTNQDLKFKVDNMFKKEYELYDIIKKDPRNFNIN